MSYQLGEKLTAYSYSHETKRFTSKIILKIETATGIITSASEILKEQRQFYQTLYSYQRITNNTINDLLDQNIPMFYKCIAVKLEDKVCMPELVSTLMNMIKT